MKFNNKKIIKLEHADIHPHYANNAGRGKDNVTITFVVPDVKRRNRSNQYDTAEVLKQYKVSGWKGHINVPTADIKYYGGLKEGPRGGTRCPR
ncbi:MAG: hypothetical protein QM235_10625 [Pseudomonadota bacterium]|jgi:hypothetical protein|nr:hypothetical protein [Pseudomonadota bacterium]